jgi:predicted type IV restriction endonuclease
MGQATTEDRTEEVAENGLQVKLADITTRLRQGRFQNEQAVSQGIVLPIHCELGCDIFDTTLVWPEYQTGEGRADFYLRQRCLQTQ